MFGAYIRAVMSIGGAVLVGVILQFIVPFLLPFVGAEDTYLYNAFSGIADNAIFIMLVAVGAGLLARAVVESNRGVRR